MSKNVKIHRNIPIYVDMIRKCRKASKYIGIYRHMSKNVAIHRNIPKYVEKYRKRRKMSKYICIN